VASKPASPITYQVSVESRDRLRAQASSHGHSLTLGVRRGDPAYGFNAAETLLAALGTCLITNLIALGAKMRLAIEGLEVQVEGDRLDDPPRLVEVRYRAIIHSREPAEKLERLYSLAVRWGTVTNTLASGVQISGEWQRGPIVGEGNLPGAPPQSGGGTPGSTLDSADQHDRPGIEIGDSRW
jgi:uncharacterized OsmC-like protein